MLWFYLCLVQPLSATKPLGETHHEYPPGFHVLSKRSLQTLSSKRCMWPVEPYRAIPKLDPLRLAPGISQHNLYSCIMLTRWNALIVYKSQVQILELRLSDSNTLNGRTLTVKRTLPCSNGYIHFEQNQNIPYWDVTINVVKCYLMFADQDAPRSSPHIPWYRTYSALLWIEHFVRIKGRWTP
jgi:hypothetical protein